MSELARIEPVAGGVELVAQQRADTDSWTKVFADVVELARGIAGTEFVPKSLRDSVPATTAAILYGREVGLPPMTALTQTHVIEGKPAISAEGMRALVLAAGHKLVVVETTGATCTMKARRAGEQDWTALTWTIDMARAAGLAGKGPWKTYPRQMLQARCTTELVRLVFPDVIHGFRSTEELEDQGDVEALPAGSSSTVQRRTPAPVKKAARGSGRVQSAAAAGPPRVDPPAAAAPPPLPGEEGYDELADLSGSGPRAGGGRVSSGGEAARSPQPGAASSSDSHRGDGSDGVVEGGEGDAPLAGQAAGDDGGSETGGTSASDPTPEPEPERPGPEVVEAEIVDERQSPEPEPPRGRDEPEPRPSSKPQHRMIFARLDDLGIDNDDRAARLQIVSIIASREITSFNHLTSNEARHVIDTLARVETSGDLWALLDALEAPTQNPTDQEPR